MDSYGNEKAPLDLIGYGKENTSYHLSDGESMTPNMRQHEQEGAQEKGHDHTPPSEEAIEQSPKKDLFCHRSHYPTNKEEEENVVLLCRQGSSY